jgi:hypothetical protein
MCRNQEFLGNDADQEDEALAQQGDALSRQLKSLAM